MNCRNHYSVHPIRIHDKSSVKSTPSKELKLEHTEVLVLLFKSQLWKPLKLFVLRPRILCMVSTAPVNYRTKAVHVAATWAGRCDHTVFLSSTHGGLNYWSDQYVAGLNIMEVIKFIEFFGNIFFYFYVFNIFLIGIYLSLILR